MNAIGAGLVGRFWRARIPLLVMLLGLVMACGAETSDDGPLDPNNPPRPPGPPSSEGYDYVSAYENSYQHAGGPGAPDAGIDSPVYDAGGVADMASADVGSPTDGPDSPSPTVERGDIFRQLGGGLILNLNPYRGLQVIDLSDVDAPRVLGRLPIEGSGVELQVLGDRAFALLDSAGGSADATVVEVDISQPSKPTVVDQARLPGRIVTSRIVTGSEQAALYVVSSGYQESQGTDGTDGWGSEDVGGSPDAGTVDMGGPDSVWWPITVVTSFDLASGELDQVDQLSLEGEVGAVQATARAIMVARIDYSDPDQLTTLAVIDIADPAGTMIRGDDVPVRGEVRNLFNIDLYNGVLRVVSSDWGANYVETFDADDLRFINAIDAHTFGEGEDLYATLFLGNKAFFVTFRQIDPFHAFLIGDDGQITEMSEFEISGWNDFFAPVFGGDRLIGIGIDNAGGPTTLAVSLYDATDLANPEPLVDRVTVGADGSWSEALWDDRAFSVIENAVQVEAADGTLETGLVLLPFEGYEGRWEWEGGAYQTGVQIFTFSQQTLTRRGAMDAEEPVRRSFMAEENVTANLTDGSLTLHDTQNPDAPVELGHVVLAPNYLNVFIVGDFLARVRSATSGGYDSAEVVEMVSLGEDVDLAPPVASLEVAPVGSVVQVGRALVSFEWSEWGEALVRVLDLRDPSHPSAATLEVGAPFESWGGGCWNCGSDVFGLDAPLLADSAVLLAGGEHQEEPLHMLEECYTYPTSYNPEGCWDYDPETPCRMYEGGVVCTSEDGGEPVCEGEISVCEGDEADGYPYEYHCEAVEDLDTIATTTTCERYPVTRTWLSLTLDIVGLVDPTAPTLARVTGDPSEELVGIVAGGREAYYSFAQPVAVEGDPRPHAAFFVRRVDLTDPASPVLGEPINIPGAAVAIAGDQLVTHDRRWDADGVAASSLALVTLSEGRARLLDRLDLGGSLVRGVHSDGAGHLIVEHEPLEWDESCWERGYGCQQMTWVEVTDGRLLRGGDLPTESWSQILELSAERIVAFDGRTVLAIDTRDSSAPTIAARIDLPVWSSAVRVSGDEIFAAAGRHGLFRFPLE
jgi:hypothetical protein